MVEFPDLFPPTVWRRKVVQFQMTRREAEVALLICRGLSNKRIAVALGISMNTLRIHMKRLFLRLQVDTRVQVPLRLIHPAKSA